MSEVTVGVVEGGEMQAAAQGNPDGTELLLGPFR